MAGNTEVAENFEVKCRELAISTSTVTSNLNRDIPLPFLTRFIPIYDINDPQLDLKAGGVFNLEYYYDYPRSILDYSTKKSMRLLKKKKKEFDNQATINFKYWGFRKVNIKIFNNGILQITGIKTEDETGMVSSLLADYLKNLIIPIYWQDLPTLESLQSSGKPFYHYYLKWENGKVKYHRYLENYQKIYSMDQIDELIKNNQTNMTNYTKILKEFETAFPWNSLQKIDWTNNTIIEQVMTQIVIPYINGLSSKIPNLKNPDIDMEVCKKSTSYLDCRNYLEQQMKAKLTAFWNILNSEQLKLQNVYEEDKVVCEWINNNPKVTPFITKYLSDQQGSGIMNLKYSEIEETPKEYTISNIRTHLINSDYNVNFYLDLNKVTNVLRKYQIYSFYSPIDHPSVLAKLYYNDKNAVQGICSCNPHCSVRSKRSNCVKITVCIFRSGSVIQVGSRNITQITTIYNLINKILVKEYENIKGVMSEDDYRSNSFMNNDLRKLNKKAKVFYFNKADFQF